MDGITIIVILGVAFAGYIGFRIGRNFPKRKINKDLSNE